MRSAKKNSGAGGAQGVAEASAKSAVKDPTTSRLLAMGKGLGNEEMKRQLASGNSSRDELLGFLAHRLGSIRQAQVSENDFGRDSMRSAWRAISDNHKPEVTLPEPTRWHESARLYEEAAYQLCRGDLSRGAQLVEQGMESERRAFEAVGSQIGVDDLGPDEEGPATLGAVGEDQGCSPTDMPAEIESLASSIQSTVSEFKTQPIMKRKPDPWWTLDEEEEEEEGEAS